MVFGDTVLHNLVIAHPTTLAELHTVSGIGPEKADRYGADIIALCRWKVLAHVGTLSTVPIEKSHPRPKSASFAAAAEGPFIFLAAAEKQSKHQKPSHAHASPPIQPKA